VEVLVNLFFDKTYGPVLRFHLTEEVLEVVFVKIAIRAALAELVLPRQFIEQFSDDFHPFEVAERLQFPAAKAVEVVLDDGVAKGMEGEDVHLVGVRPDEREQPLPHGLHPSVGEGEAEDVVRLCVGSEQDVADAGGEDVGLARARPGDDQHGAFDGVHGLPLRRVEALQLPKEGFVVGLDGHCGANVTKGKLSGRNPVPKVGKDKVKRQKVGQLV
jgi:hypothetical protein